MSEIKSIGGHWPITFINRNTRPLSDEQDTGPLLLRHERGNYWPLNDGLRKDTLEKRSAT